MKSTLLLFVASVFLASTSSISFAENDPVDTSHAGQVSRPVSDGKGEAKAFVKSLTELAGPGTWNMVQSSYDSVEQVIKPEDSKPTHVQESKHLGSLVSIGADGRLVSKQGSVTFYGRNVVEITVPHVAPASDILLDNKIGRPIMKNLFALKPIKYDRVRYSIMKDKDGTSFFQKQDLAYSADGQLMSHASITWKFTAD